MIEYKFCIWQHIFRPMKQKGETIKCKIYLRQPNEEIQESLRNRCTDVHYIKKTDY